MDRRILLLLYICVLTTSICTADEDQLTVALKSGLANYRAAQEARGSTASTRGADVQKSGEQLMQLLLASEERYFTLSGSDWKQITAALFEVDTFVSKETTNGNLVLKLQVFEMVLEALRRKLCSGVLSEGEILSVLDELEELRKRFPSLGGCVKIAAEIYQRPLDGEWALTVATGIRSDRVQVSKITSPAISKLFRLEEENPALKEWKRHERSQNLLAYYMDPAPWILSIAVTELYAPGLLKTAGYGWGVAQAEARRSTKAAVVLPDAWKSEGIEQFLGYPLDRLKRGHFRLRSSASVGGM